MFPIMMDEPDAMTVAPRAWQLLQDAWRGQPRSGRVERTERRRPPADPQPTPLASLAFGTASVDPHPRR